MLTPHLLNDLLHAVGDVLRERDRSVSILVVGGAALLLDGYVHRETTIDVDVLAQIENDQLVDPASLPDDLVAAVQIVAEGYGLPSDWLNAVVATSWTGHWPPVLPADPLDGATRLEFSGLVVYLATSETLVPFKLHAAVDRTRAAGVDADGRVTAVDLSPPDARRHLADLVALKPSDADLDRAAEWLQTQAASPDLNTFIDAVCRYVRDARS